MKLLWSSKKDVDQDRDGENSKFTDQNSKKLEIKENVSITLIIGEG